jgi:GDP-4-dehydro-6-deoxy-D-mannose reductase
MRVLVTGAQGFVGRHFGDALKRLCGSDAEIIATAKQAGQDSVYGAVLPLDITDRAAVADTIARSKPNFVVHLAGIASPTVASVDPDAAWQVHVHGARALAHAIMQKVPDCWMIHVGSGLVYGDSARTGLPFDEDTVLAPVDEYGVTKAAADLALGALARRGLKCIRMRPFNHAGPGQSDAFVVPAFAVQIARIEAGVAPPVIRVGNLEAQRDFLDVRDVARAYALVVTNAERLEPGTVLNIASGVPRRMSEVLSSLLAKSRVEISVEQGPGRMRPSGLPIIVGAACRARKFLGWEPEHSFDDTLEAVLNDARAHAVR